LHVFGRVPSTGKLDQTYIDGFSCHGFKFFLNCKDTVDSGDWQMKFLRESENQLI